MYSVVRLTRAGDESGVRRGDDRYSLSALVARYRCPNAQPANRLSLLIDRTEPRERLQKILLAYPRQSAYSAVEKNLCFFVFFVAIKPGVSHKPVRRRKAPLTPRGGNTVERDRRR